MLKKLAFIFLPVISFSQVLYNNGSDIFLKSGSSVTVNGTVQNSSGSINLQTNTTSSELIVQQDITNNSVISADGIIRLSGNWSNNNQFNSDNGTVLLEGNFQEIGGTVSTYFNNLTLKGNGNKKLTQMSYVTGSLDLTDRELETDTFRMTVTNNSANAIQRTTGFVSGKINGRLCRHTLSQETYLFPVGSSEGTLRYRPVEITPSTSNEQVYSVNFANHNASDDGYNIQHLQMDICDPNPYFYHLIGRISGNDKANISVYYDEIQDGKYTGLANWSSEQIWKHLTNTSVNTAIPLSRANLFDWNDFSSEPFILHDCDMSNIHVFIPNIFSPNNDHENDILFIRSRGIMELDFVIFNRWGEEVFKTTDKYIGWNGTYEGKKCEQDVYVYTIKATMVNNEIYLNHGTITLVR